jgi:hypothetical protein
MFPSSVSGKGPFVRTLWQRLSKRQSATFEQRRHAAPPVLIYQFGKVGSTSIQDSLLPRWPGLVVHAHTINQRDGEPAQVKAVREVLQRAEERVFIITTVRDPIARNISAFFQNFERETGSCDTEAYRFSVQSLIELFLEKFPHDTPLKWFDNNLKVSTGIDVFEYNFPPVGVQMIRRGNVDLLLMKSEIPDWLKESAIEQVLGLDQFRLKAENVGHQKCYAKTYRDFLHTFVAPDWYVQKMYGSRLFQHFYSAQRETLTALWTRKPTVQHTKTVMEAPVARRSSEAEAA